MNSKKLAEDTAYLMTAVQERAKDPELWKEFVEAVRENGGEYIKPLSPIDLDIEEEKISIMRRADRTFSKINAFEPGQQVLRHQNSDYVRERESKNLPESQRISKSEELKEKWQAYLENESIAELRQKRAELPMNQHRNEVFKLIDDHDVCVVVGATGSGKTTQVPQILLEEATLKGLGADCNIICTQPRRIAAMSVAERVAVERNEKLQQSVGYHVRFASKLPQPGGAVTFCTTGILLKQLQDQGQQLLDQVSHILIDEVHERDILIDFLMIILRRLLKQRKEEGKRAVKVVLMSATIDTSLFCQYFGEGYPNDRCPSIEIPGRTFPVKHLFLDDFAKTVQQKYSRFQAPFLHDKETFNYLQSELNLNKARSRRRTEGWI